MMKSCICFKEGYGSEGSFSTVAIQSLLWLFITSFISACRDLNFRLPLCVDIKFRAELKVALLAHFSLMSRLIIDCRDISKLWEDNISSVYDIWHFMT